jgi:hypothetical protein
MKRALLALLVLGVSVNCGNTNGQSASYLIIDRLEASQGHDPNQFSGNLASDLQTAVFGNPPTIFADNGRVLFRLGMRDAGSPGLPTVSTPINAITVTRYRVKYIRSDGRNTQGVDVPYAFDGAATGTVQAPLELIFTLVRAQAKVEAPLATLLTNFNVLNTLAEVTFYGHDQTGREVSVTGMIGVNFADWGD